MSKLIEFIEYLKQICSQEEFSHSMSLLIEAIYEEVNGALERQ